MHDVAYKTQNSSIHPKMDDFVLFNPFLNHSLDMSITTITKSFRNSHFVWMFIKDLVGIVIIDQRIIAFESSFFTS